ncbi:hypothetical protein LN42_03250 [Marinitoga sp. 1137]|uniref:heavy-metal-associated domain-containing protein n=1 Tax=Marinitoga sp. 1137 TaxID=1545835 RepID=UPI000950AA93|nr:cation transporter [Marinitoga sp. 1137]APT75518.1 hypothetical protein LN42_03250 [Marinitoga sp. 1137]
MKKEIIISGMNCEHCIMHVKRELTKLPDINILSVEIGKAVIKGNISDEKLIEAIDEAGYEIKEIKIIE